MRIRTVAIAVGLMLALTPALADLAARSSFDSRSLAQDRQGKPRITQSKDYPVQPVSFTAVRLTDTFWAPRIEVNRTETIPFAFQQCELSGRVENFIRAAKALRGETLEDTKPPGYPFDD